MYQSFDSFTSCFRGDRQRVLVSAVPKGTQGNEFMPNVEDGVGNKNDVFVIRRQPIVIRVAGVRVFRADNFKDDVYNWAESEPMMHRGFSSPTERAVRARPYFRVFDFWGERGPPIGAGLRKVASLLDREVFQRPRA